MFKLKLNYWKGHVKVVCSKLQRTHFVADSIPKTTWYSSNVNVSNMITYIFLSPEKKIVKLKNDEMMNMGNMFRYPI